MKSSPLLKAVAILATIVIVGTVLGGAWGILESHAIATKISAESPRDPQDMLHMVVVTYLVLGFVASTVLGLLVASIVFLVERQNAVD